jgi:hypothetical protein
LTNKPFLLKYNQSTLTNAFLLQQVPCPRRACPGIGKKLAAGGRPNTWPRGASTRFPKLVPPPSTNGHVKSIGIRGDDNRHRDLPSERATLARNIPSAVAPTGNKLRAGIACQSVGGDVSKSPLAPRAPLNRRPVSLFYSPVEDAALTDKSSTVKCKVEFAGIGPFAWAP